MRSEQLLQARLLYIENKNNYLESEVEKLTETVKKLEYLLKRWVRIAEGIYEDLPTLS